MKRVLKWTLAALKELKEFNTNEESNVVVINVGRPIGYKVTWCGPEGLNFRYLEKLMVVFRKCKSDFRTSHIRPTHFVKAVTAFPVP